MKHQASLRVIALLTCGSLLCADALEASSNLASEASASAASPRAKTGTAAVVQPTTGKSTTPKTPAPRAVSSKTSRSKSSSARRIASRRRAAQLAKKNSAVKSSAKKSVAKKTYSSRYRSSASAKKYARSSSKKRSRKYYSRNSRRYTSSRYTSSRKTSRRADPVPMAKAFVPFSETWHETLRDEELMPGVRYKHYIISTGSKHSIHVLEVDRTKPEVAVAMWKAQNLSNGLESLPAIAQRADSGKSGVLQGMVNANFWRSYYNTALGPAVVNGEVLEMGQYKGWSSCFFDRQNRMYIERFSLSATLRTRETSFPVETVNARINPNGVVLYNRYAGKEIPVAPMLPIENIEQGTIGAKTSKTKNDVASTLPTDDKPSPSQIQKSLDIQQRMAAAERPLYKATLLYASQPMINEEVSCRVVEVDTGAVAVPQNGVVISFGRNIDESELPRPGDKVTLMFKTNTYSSVPFVHAVSGTPRLVRSGYAKHEAGQEGTTGRNFITQKLPRTAIGTNSSGTTLYFVTTDPTDSEAGTTGMTLQELAEGMRQIGAYNAVNLDGGASASMVVRGDVNAAIGSTRPVALALGIVQQDPTADRNNTPKRKLITKPVAKPGSKSEQQRQSTPRQDAMNISGTEQSLNMEEFKPEERR
jgi:hypothetical protein